MIKKILKTILAILYISSIFILITIPIKYYTDWVFKKDNVSITIITIFFLIIARIILNKIAFIIGKLSTNVDLMTLIDIVITWFARIIYFYTLYQKIDMKADKEITISIFMGCLYFVFTRFFNHGLVYYAILSEVNKRD